MSEAKMSDASTMDDATLRARLEERLGPVLYSDLVAHLARDAVFVVAPALTLVECAFAIARDDVPKVEAWIAAGQLRKPSANERAAWSAAKGRTWASVVVQPFVLVQDAPPSAGEA